MPPANISTAKRVSYAEGYLALGMIVQATEELGAVDREDQNSLPVLLVLIELKLAAKQWLMLIVLASRVAELAPDEERPWICWAYALRALDRVAEAREVLRKGGRRHGRKSALLNYNLACYECLLGDKRRALSRFLRACKLGGKQFQALALSDPDLQTVQAEIAALE